MYEGENGSLQLRTIDHAGDVIREALLALLESIRSFVLTTTVRYTVLHACMRAQTP